MTREVSSAERSQTIKSMCIDGLKREKKELKAERESIYKSTIEVLTDNANEARNAIRETSIAVKEMKGQLNNAHTILDGLIKSKDDAENKVKEQASQSAFSKIVEGFKELCLQMKQFFFG